LSRLRYLMGMRGDSGEISGAVTTVESRTLPPLADLIATAAKSRPDLRASEMTVQSNGERAKWEGSQILAMMAPTLSVKEVGTAGTRAGPGLNMEIPILSHNRGKISRANAEVVRAGRQYAAMRDRIEHEVSDAYARVTQAKASLAQLRERVQPLVDDSI